VLAVAMDELSAAILQALAEAPGPDGMSLPRLGKRLGQGASVLLRHLALMGDAPVGGVAGPGWVRVVREDDRWVVHLTDAGRQAARAV
jgi:FdhD protein